MKKYLFIIIIAFFSIFVLYKISYKEPYSSKSQIKTTSLNTSSALPAELLTIYGKGFLRTDSLLVRFFDNKEYDITLSPVQVTDTGVIVVVPPYVDFKNFTFGPGTVNVQIVGQSGVNTSDSVTLNVQDLPKFTDEPGTITLQFLSDAILQIEDTKKHLSLVENILNGSFLPSDKITSLNKLALAYTELKNEVASVMTDTSKKVPFIKTGDETLYYNKETLITVDRLLGSLMQVEPTALTNNPFGISVANAASTANCQRLEGLNLNVVIACVQKRIGFEDGLEAILETTNEKHLNNPLLEKTLNVKSFLSDVTFIGLTLPATLSAYNEDLAAITAATGKDEYEIASSLKDYYLNDLALKVLDRMIPYFGTTLGILSDLIIGPSDVLYRNSFKGILLASSAGPIPPHLSVDPGRLPEQTGLNLIECGDLCNKKQKDFAVMAGVKGGGIISSIPGGISCPGDCTEIFGSNTAIVELFAQPNNGYVFNGWSLACSGKSVCSLPFGKDKAVIAIFEKEPVEDKKAFEDTNNTTDELPRLCDPGEDPVSGNCLPIKRGTQFFGR